MQLNLNLIWAGWGFLMNKQRAASGEGVTYRGGQNIRYMQIIVCQDPFELCCQRLGVGR